MNILIILVLGVAAFLIWGRDSKPSKSEYDIANDSYRKIADFLEQFAGQDDYKKEKKIYLEIANALREGRAPIPQGKKSLDSDKITASVAKATKEAKLKMSIFYPKIHLNFLKTLMRCYLLVHF